MLFHLTIISPRCLVKPVKCPSVRPCGVNMFKTC